MIFYIYYHPWSSHCKANTFLPLFKDFRGQSFQYLSSSSRHRLLCQPRCRLALCVFHSVLSFAHISSDLYDLTMMAQINIYLKLVGRGELVAQDLLLEGGDGVSCLPHLLHFVARAVRRAGVRHGVTWVAVCLHLHHQRTWQTDKCYPI